MPSYRYKAKKGPQEIVEGTVEAETEAEAVEKICARGYIPVKVESALAPVSPQHRAIPVGAGAGRAVPLRGGGRVRARDITVFTRQLASLLRSGVPILNALSVIAEQSERAGLRRVLETVRDSIRGGTAFSSTLELHPKIFPPIYVAMVQTGENSGHLPEVLTRIASYRADQEVLIGKVRMALAYPGLMGVVGLGTIVFMLTFVMPRLMGIFTSMGGGLPLPTKLLIALSAAVCRWWYVIIAATALAVSVLRRYAGTKGGRMALSRLSLATPVFGSFALKAELSRFSRTLELLIMSGVPILKALDIAIPVLDNEVIKEKLRESRGDLEQGGSLGMSLQRSAVFPPFMTNLLIIGEQSGKLDESLGEAAATYERETDEAVKTLASLLEPVMILVMGLIVGFIVIAMLMPIFEINVMVH